MSQDMELIEQNGGPVTPALSGFAKRLPHVHHRKPDLLAFFLPGKDGQK